MAVGGTTDTNFVDSAHPTVANGTVAGDGALVQVRSCGTLVILITSFGEFLLYFIVTFYFIFIYKKKKNSAARLFSCAIFLLQESIFSGSKILRQVVQVLWEN